MSHASRIVAAAVLTTALAGAHSTIVSARPARALSILDIYMTTDGAYTAYTLSNPITPPKVALFPSPIDYLGLYFHFRGAKAGSTTFHVDFAQGAKVLRTGQTHTFAHVDGFEVLDLPGNKLQGTGTYQAQLYVNSVLAATTSFKLVATPTIGRIYMITGAAWDAFTPNSSAVPAKTKTFPATSTRVAVYYSYKGAGKKDQNWAIVYDKYGAQVHSSHKHSFAITPNGVIALVLPKDSGAYAAGAYRTDVYFNGAVVQSTNWNTK